jgi:putative transposase
MNIFHKRKGQMGANITYFYTASIYQFFPLLQSDALKEVVIQSWQYLTQKQMIRIYGYVIMPNHVHVLWAIPNLEGKESPAAQFAKYTGHMFKRYLETHDPLQLAWFKTNQSDRNYQFWQRDPLAIPIDTDEIFFQKLTYIHNNPVREKWSLARYPEDYRWSSAGFYLTDEDEFKILTHYRDSY